MIILCKEINWKDIDFNKNNKKLIFSKGLILFIFLLAIFIFILYFKKKYSCISLLIMIKTKVEIFYKGIKFVQFQEEPIEKQCI